ncbi:MAG: hypothetical protein BWY28_02232 [bacterium ADurb.Bin236]|nr:MAG: hypothetical protein BWY28_02232 [bacterium ADurb.Bin236]HPN93045.1 hypothetical protein [bacterium]
MADAKKTGSANSLVWYLCVILTLASAAVVAAFGFFYAANQNNIGRRVVLIMGAEPPSADAKLNDVRLWLDSYSDALPGCLCAVGRPAQEEPMQSILLCVGFKEGENACAALPEKMPGGVTAAVSSFSDADTLTRVFFLLSRLVPGDWISPRTDALLQKP